MAGDWIKVEVATAGKAEVLRMASMLGMNRRECMGLLVDYWAWLDANARAEFVPNLSRICLDDVLHCAGLASSLEAVGWAKWADDGWGMTVINYAHHNGNTAKTRAYEQKKKSLQRRDKIGTKPGPEKRREELNTKRERVEAPTQEHVLLAKSLNINWADEWERYLDHQANAKHKHTDREAGFRNWLKRADEFGRKPSKISPIHDKRAATAAAMLGPKESSEPSDITAEVIRVA